MKSKRQENEAQLDMAKAIMMAWMKTFPAPECWEQQLVVDATLAWLDSNENIGQN